jgi:hypothetical protein
MDLSNKKRSTSAAPIRPNVDNLLQFNAKDKNQLKKLENAFDTESRKRPIYYGSQKGGIEKT